MSDVQHEVERLVTERDAARARRDFVAADELRERIAELGYRVVDAAAGPAFEPLEPAAPPRVRPADVPSVLEEQATADVSIHWVVEGWPEDVLRALDAFRIYAGGRAVQYVVADATRGDPGEFGDDVEVVALEEGTGWGAARNAGLRRSRGRVVLVVDGSIEPTGDVFGPLEAVLADDAIGVCGPFGIVSRDLREFEASPGVGLRREVDAVEGYLMAFRRDVLRDAGLFDERFRWYRTADIDCSFRIRDAGRRAVVVDVPIRKHEHRMWNATEPAERDRLSKRNYYRFLERFRGRTDLLVSEPPGEV